MFWNKTIIDYNKNVRKDLPTKYERILRFNIYFKYINSKIDELEKIFLRKEKIDITQREFMYISLIGNYPDLTHAELIKNESISKSTFSNQVKVLERKGFVNLKNDSLDKRRKYLKLTEKGESIFKVYVKIREFFYDNYLSELDENEKETLFNIGEKMANKMRELSKKKIQNLISWNDLKK